MTTRLRAGPRSMAAMFVLSALLAATMLIAATPVSAAAATNQVKFQQYNEAPTITLSAATIVMPTDFGLVPEVASPPAVAWTSSNQVFAGKTALLVARAAPLAAQYNNLTLSAAGNASNDFKMNAVIENARAASATDDAKMTATSWAIDAKKISGSTGAVDGT